MYQFTTTTVINQNLDENSNLAKFSADTNLFIVRRVNNFKKDNVVSVYKRAYEAGVKEEKSFVFPACTSGKVVRVTVDVRLSQKTDSEYANYHVYFAKPQTIEFISSGTASTDAAELVKQLKALKDRFGSAYIGISNSGATVTVKAINNNQRFESIKVEEEAGMADNSIIEPKYTDKPITLTTVINGRVGFGDDEHMIRSIMFPTYENSRFFGFNKEERPIIGGNYTQFTIRYSVDKHIDDGIVSGGKSITTHVFYVKQDLVAAFEAALASASLTVNTVGLSLASDGASAISLAGDTTRQLTAAGNFGTVTYKSSDAAVATVDAAGLVTGVGEGSTTIVATDATGLSATISFTVTA